MTNNSSNTLPDGLALPEIHHFEKAPAKIVAATPNREVIAGLKKGIKYCFADTWGTAMAFYSWLKKEVNKQYPVTDYKSSRINQDKLKALSGNLFITVVDHSVTLSKAPENPWLREFFPGEEDFHIAFPDFLGLNGARQWFENGISYPGLKQKIHPFYGTYFPTRTEHLVLFDNWLKENDNFFSAIDLGAGCGVLSFYMLKHNVKNIIASDINPNALYSISLNLSMHGLDKSIRLKKTSLLENINTQSIDLLVFNPPWIPGDVSDMMDSSMYYKEGFFNRFFDEAYNKLPAKCTIVIIFSNFAAAAGLSDVNPIEKELSDNKRFSLIEKRSSAVMQQPSKRKNWLSEIRQREELELWALRKLGK